MIGHLILRLTLWFLLTSDFSLANITIGVAVALLLPRSYTSPEVWEDWLKALWKVVAVIPAAYMEAFEMILHPHHHEEIVMERVHPRRTPGLVFLDVFLITFTPKTIAIKHHKYGWYKVHRLHKGDDSCTRT